MSTRNVKQFGASINKLSHDDLKYSDIMTITENGKPVIVSVEHDDIIELASELRKLASKLLSDERDFANAEVVRRMTKDKDLLVEYAMKMQRQASEEDSRHVDIVDTEDRSAEQF